MATPQQDFTGWFDEHYFTDADSGTAVCRRCFKIVGYVTKHAVERHGDPIEVMPITNDNPKLAASF